MRGILLAIQFLTRLPTPQLAHFDPAELWRCSRWFPLVGLLIGAILAGASLLGSQIDPWLGAIAALAAWVWVTGALHLDGLADMSDALGAAHRDPERFLAVLKDPHVGSFGVVALVLAIVTKLVLLMLVAGHGAWLALMLVPAWARLGTLVWSLALPPLAAGNGERFRWAISWWQIGAWTLLLAAASVWLAPSLLAAPVLIALYGLWLKRRLGGMTGDCLGAGVELVEIGLLLSLVR
ncbi:MAG: adenosylcobinamide-GDP ribazoletransferase [Burkholderiaceae bacterium]